jgi:hypothetical protein
MQQLPNNVGENLVTHGRRYSKVTANGQLLEVVAEGNKDQEVA